MADLSIRDSGFNTFLTISAEGRIALGPDITWDEAAKFLLDALERQLWRRVVGVDRRTPSAGADR